VEVGDVTSAESDAAAAAVSGEQAVARQIAVVSQQAAQIQNSAKSFTANAGSGFHIEPQAAATLIKACTDSLRELDELQLHVERLKQAPQLGETPGAKVISHFTQQVATDPRGILPALDGLKATLNDMIAAYRKASTNYAETEEFLAQSFKQQ
jgi:hypothetical protein